jgi:hypothetical protein
MSSNSSQPSSYQIAWLAQARQQLGTFKSKAMMENNSIKLDIAGQLKTILRALQFVPLEWSVANEEKPQLNLTAGIVIHGNIVVNFGVNQESRTVFVHSLQWLTGYRLASVPEP